MYGATESLELIQGRVYGKFETQLVYDVHNLHTQEYLRTFSEIKTVVRLYWVEG